MGWRWAARRRPGAVSLGLLPSSHAAGEAASACQAVTPLDAPYGNGIRNVNQSYGDPGIWRSPRRGFIDQLGGDARRIRLAQLHDR